MLNNMGLGLMFTAKDMASGKITHLENNFNSLDSQLSETEKKFNKSMQTFQKGLKMFSVGAGIVAGIGATVVSAGKLQEQMIGVQKTTGMADAEIEKLQNRFMKLSQSMPASATEMAKVGEIAGQLGIQGASNIEAFTVAVTKMGVATELTVEGASESLAKLSNVLKLPIAEAERLGSVINEMSNTSTANAEVMVDSMRRMAGAGRTFGLTTSEIASLSATLSDLGVRARVGGTAMTQLFTKMTKDTDKFAKAMGMSTDQLKTMIDEQGVGAIQNMLKHMQGLDKYGRAEFLESVGINSTRAVDAILKMADGTDTLSKHLKTANEAWKEGTSLNKEYENALKSLNNQWDILINIYDVFIKRVGFAVMPLATGLVKVFQTLGKVLNLIPDPILEVIAVTASLIGIALTLGGAFLMAQGALGMLISFMAGAGMITTATFGALLSQVLLPITLIVGALVALRYAWEYNLFGIKDFVTKWWKKISLIFKGVRTLFDPESYGQLGEGLRDKLKDAGLLDFVVSLYVWGNKLIKTWDKWGGVIKTLIGFVAVISSLVKLYQAWIATQTLLNAVMMANPIGLVIGALALLATGITLLIRNWDDAMATMKEGLAGLLNHVPDFMLPKGLEKWRDKTLKAKEESQKQTKTVPNSGESVVSGASIMKEKQKYVERTRSEREKVVTKNPQQGAQQVPQSTPVVVQIDGREVGKASIEHKKQEEILDQEEY